ncbi:MAG: 2Fe-2S iron-sulfur cluster-binding protein [Pseudorhodobacter sp.]|nr:2Fe-2S iron-sulfur cluster-binding protein [Pseudorhodobacter sp.]
MSGVILWHGRALPYRVGESVASALLRAGVFSFGRAATGQTLALFCGIGQCQGCLIRADGRVSEACLLACRDGMVLTPAAGGDDV